MAGVIPNLWPEFRFDVVAPATILRRQAENLRDRANGLLDAELTTVAGEKDAMIHRLDVIALCLDGQRYRVLTATHRADYYPVQIEADCFRPKLQRRRDWVAQHTDPTQALTWPPADDWRAIAHTQAEFIEKLGEVLKSGEVQAAINSFLARSNERQLAAATEAPAS